MAGLIDHTGNNTDSSEDTDDHASNTEGDGIIEETPDKKGHYATGSEDGQH